jgi:hypothetical protein
MVIINNMSNNEWKLILSILKKELRNDGLNYHFPKRKDEIRKLIKKIEGFLDNSDSLRLMNQKLEI